MNERNTMRKHTDENLRIGSIATESLWDCNRCRGFEIVQRELDTVCFVFMFSFACLNIIINFLNNIMYALDCADIGTK